VSEIVSGERVDLSAVQAVLLDMDGTLVDSDASVERAWQAWSGEYGIDVAAALAIAHGSPADVTIRRLLPDLDERGVADAAARQLSWQYDDLADVVASRGAHELLEVLGRLGVPWAVVTSADRRLAAARLGAAGIAPPVLVTREDVHHGKPHPEGFLQAAARLRVPPDRCLVVEDAEPGVVAGRAAGAAVAALKGLCADVCIDELGQLADLFWGSRSTR
jgi:mannitol-1-/sugar-/sorbitol-6-phosphatase